MADITPRPHVLLALVNQNIPWWKALAELVDNSFDAGATRVVVACSSRHKTVSVADDGSGVKDAVTHSGEHKLLTFDWDSFANAFGAMASAYQEGARDAKQAAG